MYLVPLKNNGTELQLRIRSKSLATYFVPHTDCTDSKLTSIVENGIKTTLLDFEDHTLRLACVMIERRLLVSRCCEVSHYF